MFIRKKEKDIEENSIQISVGQALLILIETYQHDEEVVKQLKQLYCSGAKGEKEEHLINSWLKDKALSAYIVSSDPHVINQDPTRRYFETHLAFHTLLNTLSQLSIEDLNNHQLAIFDSIPEQDREDAKEEVMEVLSGFDIDWDDNPIAYEFNDLMYKLNSPDFYTSFKREERIKMALLATCAFLSVFVVTDYNTSLPLNIYGIGIFSSANRGRVEKKDQEQVLSNHLGLMQSYSPLPVNDIAYQSVQSPYLRPVDTYRFTNNSLWAKKNFSQLVHPFSCSISGSMLGLLRLCKTLNNCNELPFNETEKFINFIKCYVSLLLFNSGGHSLYEFMDVLKHEAIQKGFEFIKDFDHIDMEIFLHDNETAFDAALKATIPYNKQIIKRDRVLDEIKQQTSPPTSPSQRRL